MVWMMVLVVAGGTAALVALMRGERVRIQTSAGDRPDAVSSSTPQG
ncbi:hypothetical protein [Actinomarinicola tropica]|uniref:Uncharacterized protein n=1 Tax=Actinomarinicola tropica TaxID=2789776 RepID=A0A5Q2RJE9_9ACTN|nr:hypothetical protein [Actinomarinicola tropica]QGG94516.1 hypothetical protein GH723_05025 [Actinomarinicola tropica]